MSGADQTYRHKLPQVCPRCHGRGLYQTPGTLQVVPCEREDCEAGRGQRALARAGERLAAVYDRRALDLWLQSPNAALGNRRPLDLLKTGHEDEVFAVIEGIPGLPKAPPSPPEPAEGPTLSPVEKPPEDPEAVRRVVSAQLRSAGKRRIASRLEDGRLDLLSDRERATLDAALTGTGFLVDGKRVDPLTVDVVRWRS